jgi:long-chain acyl-CoA synthetase
MAEGAINGAAVKLLDRDPASTGTQKSAAITADAPAIIPPHRAQAETLISLLALNASVAPTGVAIRERDLGIWHEYTWQDYLRIVCELAAGLETLGVKPKDSVVVIGDNRARLYFAMVAAATLGAHAKPLYPETPPDELANFIDASIKVAIVEDQEQIDKLLEVRAKTGGAPQTIVYDDPRGIGTYTEPGLKAYDTLVAAGAARLRDERGLQASLITRAKPNDTAVLLHSSGTTGLPKGIPLKHKHLIAAIRQAAQADYFEEGDVILGYLPMAWVGDYTFSIAATLVLRCTLAIPERQETAMHDIREAAPTMFFASARSWDNILTRLQVRTSESTPLKRALTQHFIGVAIEAERRRLSGKRANPLSAVWRAVGEALVYGPIKDQLGLSRAKRCYTAGDAIGEDTFLYFRGLGLNLKQFYGQSENCALTAAQSDDAVRLHTVGKAMPGIDLKIGDNGEILIRAPSVFDGYTDADATLKAFDGAWLRTGDAGYLEPDGQLVVLGRVSELQYTSGNERFIPTYIENRIKFSSYVRDVAVIGSGRDVLTALVCIDMEAVGHWAQVTGVGYTSYADLSQKPQVLDLIDGVLAHTNEVLPDALKIRRFVNLPKEFDPDDGEVTRTRKLRRNVIDENYAAVIAALYSGTPSVEIDVPVVYETGERGVLRRALTIRSVKG